MSEEVEQVKCPACGYRLPVDIVFNKQSNKYEARIGASLAVHVGRFSCLRCPRVFHWDNVTYKKFKDKRK